MILNLEKKEIEKKKKNNLTNPWPIRPMSRPPPAPSLTLSRRPWLLAAAAIPSPSPSSPLDSLPRFPPLQLPHAMLPDPRQALATQRAPNPTQPRHRPCPSLHSTRLEPRQPSTVKRATDRHPDPRRAPARHPGFPASTQQRPAHPQELAAKLVVKVIQDLAVLLQNIFASRATTAASQVGHRLTLSILHQLLPTSVIYNESFPYPCWFTVIRHPTTVTKPQLDIGS
jgi:hypothetical protein